MFRRLLFPFALIVVLTRACLVPLFAENDPTDDIVRLTGANGREVDFYGIWEARPNGLVVITDPESDLQLVPWDRFDLQKLKADQPAIEAARRRAVFLRTSQSVNLGLFAGVLTPAQVGVELRKAIDAPITVKVPVVYRTKTETRISSGVVTPVYPPPVYNGIVVAPVPAGGIISGKIVTTTETRQVTPDEITTSPRRVLAMLAQVDGVGDSVRRAVFELVKVNPQLLDEPAQQVQRVRASLPPTRLLANDPTLQTLPGRLSEILKTFNELQTTRTVQPAQQDRIRDFLVLVDHPILN
ncbi:hypothetical protein [Geminisphaera colitermitum]|uniref:hypothetical protein n=1 Tax=Geminisphaera colitermitum TaxID=1148786 RepID=UPI000158C9DA|nr:hypothetical protein [Geminisphaera colitermitum]